MRNILVSIVIPVYNGANYLRDAIDSALAQTCLNCEVIVVDDGSTDDTKRICLNYGDQIRYFHKENGGVSTALNLGIREMRGEYFSWLAHDDMYYPYKTERQIKALEQSSDKTAVVHANYDLLDVRRGTVSHMRQENSYSAEQLTNSVFPLLMGTIHASTPLLHKSHFDRVGLFDENQPLTQDYDLLFRALRGRRSIFLPEPLLMSRLHDQSGKNTTGQFGAACSKQYKHFSDTLTYNEIRAMFASPRAFFCRMAAIMRARANTPDAGRVMGRIAGLPEETANFNLVSRIDSRAGGYQCGICIFGAGFHGRVLKFELEHRGIAVDCFCDNDEHKHGTLLGRTPCVSPTELERDKADVLVIIAVDVSDAIEIQLKNAGFPYITTKQSLDALILECPPII